MSTLEVKDPATGTSLIMVHAGDLVDVGDLPAWVSPSLRGRCSGLTPPNPGPSGSRT